MRYFLLLLENKDTIIECVAKYMKDNTAIALNDDLKINKEIKDFLKVVSSLIPKEKLKEIREVCDK